jgi:hypothetical protein
VPSETVLVAAAADESPAQASGRRWDDWSAPGWAVWAALGGLTALAFVLRVVFVGGQSLGYEETFTASIVSHSSVAGVWRGVKDTESTPPLYYLVTWLWVKLVGSHGEAALRGTSLLAGCATVPIAFLAVRQFVDRRLALVVALLCAISPELVGYSIYARSYALVVLVSAVSVWTLGLLLRLDTWRRWTLWAIAAVACLWTHYFLGFLVLAEGVVLLVQLPGARRRLLLSLGAIVIAVAPLLPLFVSQRSASERTAFIASRPLTGRLEQLVRQFAMGANVPTAWLEAAGIALVAGAVLFALVRTRRTRATQVFAALALVGGGLPILSAATGVDDHFLARNILGVWICAAPLAAYGLMRARGIPLLAYSVICIATVIAVQSDWRYQAATDWRGASARIHAQAIGTPVAVMPGQELPIAEYYLDRAPLSSPIRTEDLWVMVEPQRASGERALNPVPNPPLAQLWGAQLRPVAEIDYRGFRLIHLRATTPTTVLPAPANNGPSVNPFAFVLGP